MAANHTFISFCFRSYCLSLAFEKTSDKRNSSQIGNFPRVSTVDPPWEFENPQQTPMDENPKFLQAAARRFFGFSIFDSMSAKPFLMVWVPFCGQNKGASKGENPLGAGFPIGARSTLLAHTLRAKYSVLDLWRPLTLKRGCPRDRQPLYGGSRKRLSTSTFHAWWIAFFVCR